MLKEQAGRPARDASDEIDDEFRALMEGLRTTIPGVMVLFSFLLILPLQGEFSGLGAFDSAIFYLAFVTAAGSSILLIAPSVHQRVRAPISGIKRTSEAHVMYATKLAIIGTILFSISISAVVYLVSSLVFANPIAVIATVAIVLLSSWSWFYLPLIRFRQRT